MTIVHASGSHASLTVDCGAGQHATGGGGWAGQVSVPMWGSYPSTADGSTTYGTNPRYWTVRFGSADAANEAWALCVPD